MDTILEKRKALFGEVRLMVGMPHGPPSIGILVV